MKHPGYHEAKLIVYAASTVFAFGLFCLALIKFNDLALVLKSGGFIPWALVTATLVASTYFAGKTAYYMLALHLASIRASLMKNDRP